MLPERPNHPDPKSAQPGLSNGDSQGIDAIDGDRSHAQTSLAVSGRDSAEP